MAIFLQQSPGTSRQRLIPSYTIELAVVEAIHKDEQSSPSARISSLKFGPFGSVRNRFRSIEPLQIFGLARPSSVSGFGFECSVEGSVGSVLGFLQVTENKGILFV